MSGLALGTRPRARTTGSPMPGATRWAMSGKREGGGSTRKTRVEHGLRDVLIEMIAADVKDPRVHAPQLLTVSKVELNVDMSVARVYVSIIGDDATADAALEGLKKAAGF